MDEKTLALDIRDGMNWCERAIKRFFDITCSFLALIILSPVFLVVAVMLLCQGDGSVIFKQERIGYKGKAFYIFKFRTMRVDSESNGKPRLAAVNDERLTKVGKFLREHHLDELPQLVNVLIGDMSFVGPRPERRYFIEKIRKENPNYDYLYLMRPGLTSMATLHNGYTDTMEKMLIRLDMDLEYLQKRSLWLDFKLIVTTFLFIVNGKKF
ncbi:MAG: sugar transferase [Bacteroidaceae bacterium]|nr:sugar transferase [Bacteroidaceae bacterium]